MQVPERPKIYHIVHVDNLASIVGDGCLWSDSVMAQRKGATVIGMGNIKQRRQTLPVPCHRGTCVGDYVPFNFCPRSIMLYVIHCANHPELGYRGGQEPIVHLETDMRSVVEWAEANETRWAFTLSNAGAKYTLFYDELTRLGEINWQAVTARDFRPPEVKEAKQAEFLVESAFPWHLIERIGVHSEGIARRVQAAMRGADYRPDVGIARRWYY